MPRCSVLCVFKLMTLTPILSELQLFTVSALFRKWQRVVQSLERSGKVVEVANSGKEAGILVPPFLAE